jgi:DNA mismatch repair protein MutS
MTETARLLIGATNRSLIILDEIGRGTSTYDGLAIARAVIEYIHNHPRLNCRTLFATHYHELTELPNVLPRAENFSVAVTERGESIVFLHRVVRGGADRSYGVHVAQLAGMPKPVVQRARELLQMFEQNAAHQRLPLFHKQPSSSPAPAPEHPALAALRDLNVEHLTPIEAMTHLYTLKQMLSS